MTAPCGVRAANKKVQLGEIIIIIIILKPR
jgi:hypothetical protein